MATHVEIASNLLRNAATFFRDIGVQNKDLAEQMEMNARTYLVVADLLDKDPSGEMDLPSDGASDGASVEGSDT